MEASEFTPEIIAQIKARHQAAIQSADITPTWNVDYGYFQSGSGSGPNLNALSISPTVKGTLSITVLEMNPGITTFPVYIISQNGTVSTTLVVGANTIKMNAYDLILCHSILPLSSVAFSFLLTSTNES